MLLAQNYTSFSDISGDINNLKYAHHCRSFRFVTMFAGTHHDFHPCDQANGSMRSCAINCIRSLNAIIK